jgi:hypothetical protein
VAHVLLRIFPKTHSRVPFTVMKPNVMGEEC